MDHTGYVGTIFTVALAASVMWCTTWSAQQLGINVWCQVAMLFGYDKKRVAQWAHNAVQRGYATTTHAGQKTTGFIHENITFFLRLRCCHVAAVLRWLAKHAFWKGNVYCAWYSPERVPPMASQGHGVTT